MKKRALYISIASVILLLAVGAVAFTQTIGLKAGQDVKAIRKNVKANKIVAKVNGADINWQTFKAEEHVLTISSGGQM